LLKPLGLEQPTLYKLPISSSHPLRSPIQLCSLFSSQHYILLAPGNHTVHRSRRSLHYPNIVNSAHSLTHEPLKPLGNLVQHHWFPLLAARLSVVACKVGYIRWGT